MQMHFFDSMRRYSRNGNTSKKSEQKASAQEPASSTPRQPSSLAPSSSLVSEAASNGSSSRNASTKHGRDGDLPNTARPRTAQSEKSSIASSMRGGNPDNTPTRVLLSSQRSTYTNYSDLYTSNDLDNFSFGAASTPSPYHPIDPLSPGHDDDTDDYLHKADTTPRPSLVPSSSPRSHSSQPPHMAHFLAPTSLPPPPRPPHSPERARTTSDASTHTFGASSASASASSLSSAALGSSTGSRHGGSTTTPHTSAHTLPSDNDEAEHQHPIPFLPSAASHTGHGDTLSLFASDDDFDSDLDRDDYEPDIDISSVIQPDPEEGIYLDDYRNQTRESFHSAFPTRRGSLAVPIPLSSTMEGRDREGSIATLRRPSRSLEGLRSDRAVDGDMAGHLDSRPPLPAPTSVPESETDWRDLRRRSIQKEKERGLASRGGSVPSLAAASSAAASSSTAVQNSALDGFDTSWLGVGTVELDHSEMADIVGGIQGPRSADRPFRRASSSTTDSGGRRLSSASTHSDVFSRNLNAWGGALYRAERARWTFSQEKTNQAQRFNSERERERDELNVIHSTFHRQPSFSQRSSLSGGSSIRNFYEYSSYSKASFKEPPKAKDVQPWKGMALDSEEWWSSFSNGRYKVVRRNQTQNNAAGKPPQQRLHITHHRTPYSSSSSKRDLSDGPTSTIHKHSKAVGFSISRHYRLRDKAIPSSSVGSLSGRASTSSRIGTSTSHSLDKKRAQNMILLAPRKVQEAYTSTTTTRMLESHGLLSESGRHSPRDLDRMERERRERKKQEKEMERQRQKEARKEEPLKGKLKNRLKSGYGGRSSDKSPETSGGSIPADDTKPGPSMVAFNLSRSGRPSTDSVGIDLSKVASGSGATPWRSHRREYDSGDEGSDDDDHYDLKRRPHRLAPHSEAFASIPIEEFEAYGQQGAQPHGIFSLKGLSLKNNTTSSHRKIDKSFDPPWALAPAQRHSDKKGIVEDLNTSFQDVGLLPASDEVKGLSIPSKRKRQSPSGSKHQSKPSKEEKPNVFHSFPAEYLYMLLPLWPGETDVLSEKKFPYPIPNIPVESRQYLLIYYHPEEPSTATDSEKSKAPRDNKKHSPTSSRDSMHKQADKPVLFDKFRICARVVSYTDIQGSGIRSPDVGLSVLGPLEEACESMPGPSDVDTPVLIGMCTSRDKGIEFVPEGLVLLGLASKVPDPAAAFTDTQSKRFSITGVDEEEALDTTVLTPIGRAVVEMAWLGSMAVTSYGP